MKCEVTSDGKTVWINSKLGFLVARFTVNLYEIYLPDETIIGKPGPLTLDDWISFKEKIEEKFNLHITSKHIPKSLRS